LNYESIKTQKKKNVQQKEKGKEMEKKEWKSKFFFLSEIELNG